MDISMELLNSGSFQVQFIEAMAVEVFNIQCRDLIQRYTQFTKIRRNSLFNAS